MSSCIPFEEKTEITHFGKKSLRGFIYTDVFEPSFFRTIQNTVSSHLISQDKKTYLTHGTTFNLNNNQVKIISNNPNGREQVVLYDLSFEKEWYYQTSDTIKDWSDDILKRSISPVFYKCIKVVEELEPFNSTRNDWIFYRTHLNYLAHKKLLSVHCDGGPQLTNVKNDPYTVDHIEARMYSITFYLYDHIPNKGGEFFSPYGFVYKPKSNTAIAINGHQAFHGVTQNLNEDPRLAFTMRLAHKDDLFLPGSPDKFLYDTSHNII